MGKEGSKRRKKERGRLSCGSNSKTSSEKKRKGVGIKRGRDYILR